MVARTHLEAREPRGPKAMLDGLTGEAPVARGTWSEIVDHNNEALAFHTPGWMDAITASGGYADASLLYVRDGRRLLVPLARRKGPLGWAGLRASLPYGWGFGGIVADGSLRSEDVRVVMADLARRPWLRTSIRPSPLTAQAWDAAVSSRTARVARVAHILDLDGGFDHVWARRFTGVARTNARRAEKSGLSVERGSDARALDAFFELYRQSVERWAGHARPRAVSWWTRFRSESRRKFELAAAALEDDCSIWVARQRERPVAAIVVLRHGSSASYWRGAMDEGLAGPTRANYLLHRLAIEEACLDGARYYHMGETGTSESLAQFKTRFGAEPYSYYEYRLERLPLTRLASLGRRIAMGAIGLASGRARFRG